MIPPTKEAVLSQAEDIRKRIREKISFEEASGLEVRQSVTHGDIEIFLNGRLFFLDSTHYDKVQQANGQDDYLTHVLLRLRGKKYIFSDKNNQYSVEDVQREINNVLSSLLDRLHDEAEKERLRNESERILLKNFSLGKLPEKLESDHLMVINKFMFTNLSRLLNIRTKKNG
jgi:hypothetical protein